VLRNDGKPIALVEAMRHRVMQLLANVRQQTMRMLLSVSLASPFIFLTTGKEIWFWDRTRFP